MGKNIREYQNNEILQEMKAQFLRGERPDRCRRCWQDEDSGLPSKRQLDWKYLFKEVAPDHDYFQSLDITFGNSCNLACRSCGSYNSSTWLLEDEKIGDTLDIRSFPHNTYYKDPVLKQDLLDASKHAKYISISGGEPFLAGKKEHMEFLSNINDPQTVELKYITNCTMMPDDQLWEIFRRFKDVEFHLSIDGTDKVFEYLRWPAEWSSVLDNMREYQRITSTSTNIRISIGHTVSTLNIWYVPEFIKWCLSNGFPSPYLGMVDNVPQLDPNNLPKSAKQKLSARLARHGLTNIVEYLNDLDGDLTSFLEWTKVLDDIRNQKIEDFLPELIELIKD